MKKYKSKFQEEKQVSFTVSLHQFAGSKEGFLVLSGINRENDTESSTIEYSKVQSEFKKLYDLIKKQVKGL